MGEEITTMDFLETNYEDAIEPQILEAGTEVEVQIDDVEVVPDKNQVRLQLSVVSVTKADVDLEFIRPLRHTLFYPDLSKDNATKVNNKNLQIKNFMEGFAVPREDATTPDRWVGLKAWAKVTIEESDQFGDQNRVAYNGFIKKR